MKIVHYINQFFAQIGGEEMADHPLEVRREPVGPGLALLAALGEGAEIACTIVCGDNYFNDYTEEAEAAIRRTIEEEKPDLVIAGPAFNAGRYGLACGNILRIANSMGYKAFSGMYPENPGAEMFRSYGWIVKTRNSAAGMRSAVSDMAALICKVMEDPRSVRPEADRYICRGQRINIKMDKYGYERAFDMMMKKLSGEPYETELPMPVYTKVPPAPAIKDLKKARIALLTTGGLVPPGNPDRIETCMATKFKKYTYADYGSKEHLKGDMIHGGCDPIYVQEDPNRMIPADVMSEFEKEGVIGELADVIYVTTGNGAATVHNMEFAKAISEDLKKEHIDGVILTSA